MEKPAIVSLRKKEMVLRVAFNPQINDYQGQSIQLMIRDFQIVDPVAK